MQKWILAFIFALLGVILLGIAMGSSWFQVKYEYDGEREDSSVNMKLREMIFIIEYNSSGDLEKTYSYSDEMYDDSDIPQIMNLTFIFTNLALILTMLVIVFAILIVIKKGSMAKIGMIVALLAFVFALIAPLYLMVALPGTFDEKGDESEAGPQDSFFGSSEASTEDGTIKTTWGGTTGWFLAIVASVFNLLAFNMIRSAGKEIDSKPSPQP